MELGIWDKLHNLATTCNELCSRLEEKTAKLAENAKNYAEEERVKDFYKK